MSVSHSVPYWKRFLELYEVNSAFSDDIFALETCKLALQAVELGNFGIGSLIVDAAGNIVTKGHNQVFYPYFRSDRHGEMVAMTQFEDQHPDIPSMKGYTLYTSLESCPMCMARLINSGCEKVIHVADDPLGGMVHLTQNLPPIWIELVQRQSFTKANCSPELEEAATQILMLNVEELNLALQKRSGR